ncbi:autophagy protein 5-like [Pollicipes pollicipes]|uniref:autophagy protein 5-like n=1 Tax=Pollicipes pollicipes TaxID=41117 RepID=UPI001884CE01|nr:autophagy protein 5-like [Pollicipes pollicipes]
MAEDRQVLRDVWEGRVPVCFRLADSEVHTVSVPEPYYLLVPRMTYFPLVIDRVRRHFSRSVHPDHQGSDVWLEWDGTPLKWHQPVGLQFDLLCTESALPWHLAVHFTSHTDEACVMKREALESFFLSSVKEADQLKHKGAVMSSLGKRDHNQLWAGLASDKFDQFWSVNRRLMEAPPEERFRSVPVRLYRPGQPYVQRPYSPCAEDGQPHTLLDMIGQLAPELAPELARAGSPRVILHGITPALETPVQWLSQHLSYADNFLHIVILA